MGGVSDSPTSLAVLRIWCLLETPGGLVETDRWAPPPEFLRGWGPEFAFQTGSREKLISRRYLLIYGPCLEKHWFNSFLLYMGGF